MKQVRKNKNNTDRLMIISQSWTLFDSQNSFLNRFWHTRTWFEYSRPDPTISNHIKENFEFHDKSSSQLNNISESNTAHKYSFLRYRRYYVNEIGSKNYIRGQKSVETIETCVKGVWSKCRVLVWLWTINIEIRRPNHRWLRVWQEKLIFYIVFFLHSDGSIVCPISMILTGFDTTELLL